RDQRIHAIAGTGGKPAVLTPVGPYRYADGDLDMSRRRLIAVREDHSDGGEPANDLVAIGFEGDGKVERLTGGCDFYAAPRISPDGSRLAWICWNHPAMPWTETQLWLADIGPDGTLHAPRRIAGGSGDGEAVMLPRWSPDGGLFFVTDRSNWWNLNRLYGAEAESVVERAAEFGHPAWQLGNSSYDFLPGDRLVCTFTEQGEWRAALVDLKNGSLEILDLPFTSYRAVYASGGDIVTIAGSPKEPEALVRINPGTGRTEVVRPSFDVAEPLARYFSVPRAIEFPTGTGGSAHAFHYAPANPDFAAPAGEKPPLIVMSHGGPTSAASSVLSLQRQFWTSRGFAVVDVNYRGSTGYGRDYRFALEEQWGIADVEDCIAAARHLGEHGDADPLRIGITGGSAGGYTTLCALTFTDFFTTGASHYGIGDLELLAQGTHKFESRYLDWLIGRYPEEEARYKARSPVNHVEKLNRPVAFFQGAEDKVVPPDQAEAMVAALRANGNPVLFILFEDEQHGFRKGANIKRALDAELLFFSVWLSGRELRFSGVEQGQRG
ncbi:MAG TPA: S9 family peptidase, partial [Afifellaceae bacterium]|nr:S9 family peptidase [Afifellaceae bacterium]